MNRRLFIAGLAASLVLPRVALAQGQDWLYRVLSGNPSDLASDINAVMVANNAASFIGDSLANWRGPYWDGLGNRHDFDFFYIWYPGPTALSPPVSVGIHCNHRITGPNAPTVEEWLWNWFGQNSGTECPTLTSYTNATVGGLAVNQVGGQSWPSTTKSVLISAAPTLRKRMWA